jgi:hypothetical protein
MEELADESVGQICLVRKTIEGDVSLVPSDGQNVQTVQANFRDDSSTTVQINVQKDGGIGLEPGDLDVRLSRTRRQIASCFSTHNNAGKHYFPMLLVESCPECGLRRRHQIEAKNVAVHVIGPIEIDEIEREELRQEVRSKVRSWTVWRYAAAPDESKPIDDRGGKGYGLPGATHGTEIRERKLVPTPFSVYQYGQKIGIVPAVVMERADAETPSLATALGWQSDKVKVTSQKRLTSG